MYVVINGGGKVGSYLGHTLLSKGHSVAVIERRPQVLEKLAQELPTEVLLIEAKASGISVIQEIQRLHAGSPWTIVPIDPKGDKVARLHSVVPLFAANMIFAPDKQWAQEVIDEVRSFPRGRFKDFVDTVSMAIRYMRDIGIALKPVEKSDLDAEDMRYKKELPPLYDV